MKYLYVLAAAIFLLSTPSFTHAQIKIKRASLSASVRDAHSIHNGSYKVQQSIGHMGIKGVSNHQEYTVLKGFLIPKNDVESSIINPDFNLQVYPNPFVDYIELDFDGTVSGEMVVLLHDVTGKLIFKTVSQVKQQQRIELGHLAQAQYILTVEAMGQQLSYSLLHYKSPKEE